MTTTPTNVVAKKGDSFTDPAGRTGTVGFDTKTGKPLADGQTTTVDTSTGGKLTPSLINTSTQSKTNHADNVNTITTANNNIKTVQAGQTASGIAASLGMSPENFLKLNPNFNATGNKGDYEGMSGLIKPGQTYKVGTDGSPTEVNNPDGSTTNTNGSTTTKSDDGGSVTTDPNDGTTSTTDADGNTSVTTSDGSVLDPSLKKQFDDNIAALSDAADNAKTVLDQAAATLADDPAAQNAAENIKSQYDVLINQMKAKNQILLGSINTNSARSGMLQYANDMDSNFKSVEFDASVQRIADLVQQENNAVSKSNAAFKSGDVTAFDNATKAYQATLKDKQKAILDLNAAINTVVKQNAADIKAAQTAKTAQLTSDIKTATSVAAVMADTIAQSGITDEDQIDEYIQKMADANGITNPNILKSALVTAQGKNTTTDLTNTRKQQVIDKAKNPTGKNTPTTFKISQGIAKVTPQMESVKGDDGFIDPNQWVAARKNWETLGGSAASFKSNFIQYLNPASYTIAGYKAPTGGVS